MLNSSLGNAWALAPRPRCGFSAGQSSEGQTPTPREPSEQGRCEMREAQAVFEAAAAATAAEAAAEAAGQDRRTRGGAATAQLWEERREAGLAPPPRSAPLDEAGRTRAASKVAWEHLTHDEAVLRGKNESAARAACAKKLIAVTLRKDHLARQLKRRQQEARRGQCGQNQCGQG